MGLKGGENGAKAVLQQRFSDAFSRFNTLAALRDETDTDRNHTAIVADGNVMLMQVPSSCTGFDAYVAVVASMVKTLIATSSFVCIVFDEPEHMTGAKKEEQSRRDSTRGNQPIHASLDVAPPHNDDYSLDHIQLLENCRDLVKSRASRQRFFDTVVFEAVSKLHHTIEKWAQEGHQTVLVIDGLDPRGAERPIGAPREPQMFSTDEAVTRLFQREIPIGEGDLKLSWVETRLRDLVDNGLSEIQLVIHQTIDTDSFAISLNDVSKRAVEGKNEYALKGALALRERGDRNNGDSASFLVCDFAHLFQLMQHSFWSTLPSPHNQLLATRLCTTSLALCGSDFVAVPGFRSDLVFDYMRTYCAQYERLLTLFGNVEENPLQVMPALRRMLILCAENVRLKRHRNAMEDPDEELLKRAAWICCYWAGHEIYNTQEFGFLY